MKILSTISQQNQLGLIYNLLPFDFLWTKNYVAMLKSEAILLTDF